MNTFLFFLSLVVGVAGPVVAVSYLRPILVKVLVGLCDAEGGAEFWVRSAYLLAICGTELLMLTFGVFNAEADLVSSLQRDLWLVMAGVFVTIAFIARNVWNQVQSSQVPVVGPIAKIASSS
ncbi:MAG TPA: hypothetical protein VGM81_09560 [Burkholderiaceae bacterium]